MPDSCHPQSSPRSRGNIAPRSSKDPMLPTERTSRWLAVSSPTPATKTAESCSYATQKNGGPPAPSPTSQSISKREHTPTTSACKSTTPSRSHANQQLTASQQNTTASITSSTCRPADVHFHGHRSTSPVPPSRRLDGPDGRLAMPMLSRRHGTSEPQVPGLAQGTWVAPRAKHHRQGDERTSSSACDVRRASFAGPTYRQRRRESSTVLERQERA